MAVIAKLDCFFVIQLLRRQRSDNTTKSFWFWENILFFRELLVNQPAKVRKSRYMKENVRNGHIDIQLMK